MSLENLQKKQEFVFKRLESSNLNFIAEFIFNSQLGKMYYPNCSILLKYIIAIIKASYEFILSWKALLKLLVIDFFIPLNLSVN